MRRLEIATITPPHFIGAWVLDDVEVCDEVIAFFETHRSEQRPGATGAGLNPAVKKSMDININPNDLALPSHRVLARYMVQLHACYRDYLTQWPFLATMLPEADTGDFNLQRYTPGEHFAGIHSERTTLGSAHRVLAWMTYLNDINSGGQTHFTHYDIKVQPARGKTLIWPAEWTHAHAGLPVVSGTKYIATGWLQFPTPDGGNTLT